MKAQTFLEWFAGYIENHALTNDGDLTNTALTFHKLKDFYSQPFKPELITELFEGWKFEWQNKSKSIESSTGECRIYFYDNKVSYEITIYVEPENNIYFGALPQTLNDFISDCNRAGSELEFKPEIVKEYFA